MTARIVAIIILVHFSILSWAQGEIEKDDGIFIQNERSIGFNLNSNGFGSDFRYGKRIDGFRKRLIIGGINYIKHPKEIKSHNQQNQSQSYVFGKLNHCINLRASIGRQKEMFSKFDKGSVAIRYFYSGGLSACILKPIYYEVKENDLTVNKKFDPAQHHTTWDIQGKAPFSEGVSETTITPGIHAEIGFSFEYSKTSKVINALECGARGDIFLNEIQIMAIENNNYYFATLFLSYRFGRLFSPRIKDTSNKLYTE